MVATTKKKSVKKAAGKSKVKSEVPSHNWDKLLDGKEHTLHPGKDFTCSERSFVIYAYSRARKKGYKISLRKGENGVLKIRKKTAQEVNQEKKNAAKRAAKSTKATKASK